jgi:uncharacterized protein DUF4338
LKLKEMIARSLRAQGFRFLNNRILLPPGLDKAGIRRLHEPAVKHRIELRRSLVAHEGRLLTRLASGFEVVPERIRPRLVEVRPESDDELLFRYASLHWSIPVSSGYGRRIRFLIIDEENEKLIGLIGLSDPVFSLAARDEWIGWSKETRRNNLKHTMDAFILGAVPPYSQLLCGKLIAMLVSSKEVRDAFRKKYLGHRSLIRKAYFDGRLALITTTSALGRSSIYNRLRFGDRLVFEKVGFTQGSGEFHFSNGLYGAISKYSLRYCKPSAKKRAWGRGFRSRREVVRKCLTKIGLSDDLLYHGIRREIFAVPLASNSKEFLRGEHTNLRWYKRDSFDLFGYFRERWMLPRSLWDQRYKSWNPTDWQLWG